MIEGLFKRCPENSMKSKKIVRCPFVFVHLVSHCDMTAGSVAIRLSTKSEQASMPSDLYFVVLEHLRSRSPTLQLHSHIALSLSPSSIPLFPRATFYDHIIVRGQKYAASTRNVSSRQSLVMVQTSASGQTWVGELQHIFMVKQEMVGCYWFGHMRWFIPVPSNRDTIWSQL
jgi:hypothetical protein